LLNVLDIHWYPEAQGSMRITDTNANSATDKAARLQAPRTLWDLHYGYSASNPVVGENSWISQWFSAYLPLIPKLIASINKYYPGTKLAFSEFTYGGEHDISGGIATADALGIFGKYGVYFASFWPGNVKTSYVQSAYRVYRNYDGAKSTFGDSSIPAHTTDSVNTSIYSSVKTGSNEIHIVAINKNLTASTAGTFTIAGKSSISSANAWVLDASSSQIRNAGSITAITGNSFTYTLPAGSVTHIVLQTMTGIKQTRSALVPVKLDLHTYPNPFNPACTIEYTLPDHAGYSLTIVDILGRTVKTFHVSAQSGSVQWDGKNEQNQSVASGAYYVVVRGGNQHPLAKKIMLMK
jgi:mannan endo-1,4-beta-mannosidase